MYLKSNSPVGQIRIHGTTQPHRVAPHCLACFPSLQFSPPLSRLVTLLSNLTGYRKTAGPPSPTKWQHPSSSRFFLLALVLLMLCISHADMRSMYYSGITSPILQGYCVTIQSLWIYSMLYTNYLHSIKSIRLCMCNVL